MGLPLFKFAKYVFLLGTFLLLRNCVSAFLLASFCLFWVTRVPISDLSFSIGSPFFKRLRYAFLLTFLFSRYVLNAITFSVDFLCCVISVSICFLTLLTFVPLFNIFK